QESVQAIQLPFDLDMNAVGLIANETGEAEPRRQAVDEGPKADALHQADYCNRMPGHWAYLLTLSCHHHPMDGRKRSVTSRKRERRNTLQSPRRSRFRLVLKSRGRQLDNREPKIFDRTHHADELVQVDRLVDVTVGVMIVR